MKILKYFTIFFSAIMLFNCGEDSATGNDGGGNGEIEVTVDNIVGTWEVQSQSWSQNVVTNQDVTFASECVAGIGSIDIAGDLGTASLTYLEFSEYNGMIDDIQVENEGCGDGDEQDIYVEIEINFIGNVAFDINLWYEGHDDKHFYDWNLDSTNYSLDGLTLTLNHEMETIEWNWDTEEYDTVAVNISGTLTAGTITAAADQSTILASETETPDIYEHYLFHLLEDGTMTLEEEIDCPLITEDDECQWNGCVWTETDGVGSCGDFTLTCSELSEVECYEYYGSCWWDYYDQLCFNEDDQNNYEESWSLGDDDTFIYVYTETSGNDTYSDTTIMDISVTSSTITLSFSQNPCGSDSYYGYYMEMMCEYYGFSDEECLAMCYEGIAEEYYGLDGSMVVSFEQTQFMVLTRVEALSRVLESAQFRHYINKINRYQLAKGMARLYKERARTQ